MIKVDIEKIKNETLPILNKRLKNDSTYVEKDGEYFLSGDFYEKQLRVALRNYDIINPESIDEYIARGGYFALEKCLNDLEPIEIINVISDSGLQGRGGAGFPTGFKWMASYNVEADQKYVICNGDEGDPGAYMDRSILEGDPHLIIEAMVICGYAIGADKGYAYVRAEYPKAVEMLEVAIEKAKDYGFLGENIMGSDFNFDLEIRLGAGAFVCGESTALIKSIEGKRGMAQATVYFPTERGLYGKPTVMNNVETFANIPYIINMGADWFKSIGSESSPGTKVFALVGKVENAGLVEVPMGMTLNEIIYDIGGGIPDGKKVKAVQTGGPSGGCIPEENFGTKVDFQSLTEIGSIMGSGGMVVMDEDDCMVDIAKFFMKFTYDESCGKCTPCRIGNKRVLEILENITSGQAQEEDLDKLETLSNVITDTSLCGLGKTATTPVSSSMTYFLNEYLEHINEHKCRAGVCRELLDYYVLDTCVGCGMCKRNCPVDAISGERREIHEIDQVTCIKCNNCLEVCPIHAIEAR